MSSSSRPGARRLIFLRVLRRRCPQCGEGALFRSYARLNETCGRCGLVYRREQGAQTGTMYMTAAASQVFAAALIFLFWWAFDWTTIQYVIVTATLVLTFCVFYLPVAQALWVGVEYATDLHNQELWAELRR